MSGPYRITVVPGNHQFSAPEGATILTAAQAAGLRLPHSCVAGSCEICMGRLLQGEVSIPRRQLHLSGNAEHPPTFLTCIALPMSDSIIEIPKVLGPGELPQFNVTCQIVEARPLNHDVTKVVLRLPAGKRIEFLPGQYLDVWLNETDKVSFSIGNLDRNDRTIELHVRYVPTSESSNKFRDY
ncbi:MAG TPA: 2Fe-2S iron-sulfur cluster-binding protein, partial [Pseudomonadales bacterium]|nr:2Fe-2S iron-sulfur cluster-binding protein [Pseudomonadales bacterium]